MGGCPRYVRFSTVGDQTAASQDVRLVPILLQKSAAADGPLAMSLKAAGFDLPALTLSAQLQRYAMH
jgi:hypothetical protein